MTHFEIFKIENVLHISIKDSRKKLKKHKQAIIFNYAFFFLFFKKNVFKEWKHNAFKRNKIKDGFNWKVNQFIEIYIYKKSNTLFRVEFEKLFKKNLVNAYSFIYFILLKKEKKREKDQLLHLDRYF